MNALYIANIDGTGDGGAGELQRAGDSFTNHGDLAAGLDWLGGWLMVAGQKDRKPREVALPPIVSPVVDKDIDKGAILVAIDAIRFALVPQDPANRVRDERRDHAVIECRGAV